MPQINCYIPIKLHITGRPSDAQLDELGETLVRALEARIAFAEETIADRDNGQSSTDVLSAVREAYHPGRETPAAEGYQLPSYNDGGELQVVAWRRRVRTGRIPRRLRAGILTRGQIRLPTRNIRWLLRLNGDVGWVRSLAVDLVSVVPEVDVTVELFRLRNPALLGAELVPVFRGYLEQRHHTNLISTPYYVFAIHRVRSKWDLAQLLGINLDDLFERARLPQPHQMTGRQRQRHVLLTYASFSTEIERYIPEELHFQTGSTIRGVSTSRGEALEPDETPEQLIDRFTSWNDLNETGLGAYLVELTRRSPALSHYVERVLDELGSTDRDDVALAFAQAATGRDLARLRRNIYGLALLERLFDELTSGSIGEREQRQANRIMLARARFRPVEEAAEQLTSRRLVFPFRMPGPTVFNDAPIFAERIGGGRIRVEMPIRVRGTSMFDAETRTLPTQVFTSGLVLDADQWISVKLYDEGGIIVDRPALYLIELANRTTARTWENIVSVAALGLTFGAGGLAIRGATWGARALAVLDTAATALFAVSIVVRDHRGWMIRTFGEAGRTFVEAVEIAGALAGAYGLLRVVASAPRVITNLRNAWRTWRGSRAYRNLGGDDLWRAEQISREAEQFLNSADEAAAAIRREAGPSAPETPPGSRVPSLGGGGPAGGGPSIVEIGAGDLQASLRLARQGARVTAVDVARTRGMQPAIGELESLGGRFVQGTARDIPSGSADQVFQYFPWTVGDVGGAGRFAAPGGTWEVMQQAIRITRPGGVVTFVTESEQTAMYLLQQARRFSNVGRTALIRSTAAEAAPGATGAGVTGQTSISPTHPVWHLNVYVE